MVTWLATVAKESYALLMQVGMVSVRRVMADDMNRIGQALTRLRVAAGLTQRQVAAHFGIDKSAVSGWETDRSLPNRAKLVGLDELYGAGGTLLRLFGFNLVDLDDEPERLRDRIAHLERVQEDQAKQIEQLLRAANDATSGNPKSGNGQTQER